MRGRFPAGIMPNPREQLPDLLLRNEGRWIRHEALRPGVLRHVSSSGEECVTVRVQLPPGGVLSVESFCALADLVDEYAQVGRRTSRNAFELVGVDVARLDELVERLAKRGFPVGGTGRSLHQIKACGGFMTCQNAAIDSPAIAKVLGDRLFGDVMAQRYPSWLKISIGGCPNQCGGGIEADIGLLGVFKGLPQVDDAAIVESQCDVPLLCFWCPTGAIKPKAVRGGMSVEINPDRCTRCTSCSNVCPSGIEMGGQRGVAVVVGGSAGNARRGPRLARLLVPFIPLESPLECDRLLELVVRVIEIWAEGARVGERIGDFVDRIGWPAFLRRLGVDFDPYLIDNFDPLSVRRDLRIRWNSDNGSC